MRKLALLAAAAVVALPSLAAAGDWVILNGGARRCEFPASPFPSPASAERAARAANMFRKTEVTRDDAGNAIAVGVTIILDASHDTVMVYFRSLQACQRGLALLNGTAGGARELE